MKAPLSILLLLSGLCQNLTAQQPVFFSVVDSACMPHTPNLSSPYVLNNALSYNWNFGNGTTSTANSPFMSYSTAGTYRLSLTVTTNATDKIVNQLTIAAIPNTWDDGLFTDPLPDLYYLVKNELGVIVFTSPVMFDKVPPVVFTNGFLMKADKNYTVELWEYDIQFKVTSKLD